MHNEITRGIYYKLDDEIVHAFMFAAVYLNFMVS